MQSDLILPDHKVMVINYFLDVLAVMVIMHLLVIVTPAVLWTWALLVNNFPSRYQADPKQTPRSFGPYVVTPFFFFHVMGLTFAYFLLAIFVSSAVIRLQTWRCSRVLEEIAPEGAHIV